MKPQLVTIKDTAGWFVLGAAIVLVLIWYSRAPRAHQVGYDGKTMADVYL